MCRPQCLLALLALSVGVVKSWDIAITTENQLEFYTNTTKTNNVLFNNKHETEMTALAYDAVQNMLLFADSLNDNASIYSYHLATKKFQSLVRKKLNESIHGIAFDPVNSRLFWTDTVSKSIYFMSLKPGSKNAANGNLWIQMDDEIPRGIAVDSCRGYVYWTNTYVSKATIERARFNGTEREVIVSKNIYMPVSLAIDQRSKRLYWADDREGIFFTIESSDLDGKHPKTLYKGRDHQPNTLTVSNDSLYWIDWGWKKVWKLPKDTKGDTEPEMYITLENEKTFGIAANYLIQDQVEGNPECKTLSSLLSVRPAINDSFSVPADMGLFCVNGEKVDSKFECKCTPGYIGERCDISVCQNFCFQGDCSISSEGEPSCRCKKGFYGGRCEVNVCTGYCLNNGQCSLDGDHKPICHCATDFEGSRCQKEKVVTAVPSVQKVAYTTEAIPVTNAPVSCNCSSNATTPSMYSSESVSTDGDFVVSCSDGWDAVRDPIIMVLGIISGLLVLTCVVLFTKILQLKKRPRIKKRIIVNKNVTPLTARPDQCEITIENCCNMNICETPCFEPRSTIRPTLLESKPGKEEKKNLIANMEFPDDY